ncbi:uncharacterized protein LOC133781702 isoform X1 [Humulus lupulus]|uniref:uncharacterized protein LOC133781702 isoform X1 n=1 Tax=Humulus lupulus TaxID=3486 RepID=UPI002B4145AD|nr:uncharacterized protein LOC133781702 isoform X1 [Humulus lupulus]XP_062076753.1 uncharacterized protein LOC133781702 isoform X1 [Humulus lupulus]
MNHKFGGGKRPTGTPSLAMSSVVVVVSLLAGASVVHNIYKPDLVRHCLLWKLLAKPNIINPIQNDINLLLRNRPQIQAMLLRLLIIPPMVKSSVSPEKFDSDQYLKAHRQLRNAMQTTSIV